MNMRPCGVPIGGVGVLADVLARLDYGSDARSRGRIHVTILPPVAVRHPKLNVPAQARAASVSPPWILPGPMCDNAARDGIDQSKRIDPNQRTIANVTVQIDIPTGEPDRILADEALEAGVVVARPRVAPSASLAGKAPASRMRVSAMRPGPAEAGRGDSVVVAATSEMMNTVDFGEYLGNPSTIRCAPGGATALRWRAGG